MRRIEIFANHSVEGDMFDLFRKRGIVKHYTRIPAVYGVGKQGPLMGDHIWPESNFMLIVYCEEEEAKSIRESIAELKGFFKTEGIKLFETSV